MSCPKPLIHELSTASNISGIEMALNSPCWDFVARWNGASVHPPGICPGLRSGCSGLPNWSFCSTHGLRASACALGAGIHPVFFCGLPLDGLEKGGRRPKSWSCPSVGLTAQELLGVFSVWGASWVFVVCCGAPSVATACPR